MTLNPTRQSPWDDPTGDEYRIIPGECGEDEAILRRLIPIRVIKETDRNEIEKNRNLIVGLAAHLAKKSELLNWEKGLPQEMSKKLWDERRLLVNEYSLVEDILSRLEEAYAHKEHGIITKDFIVVRPSAFLKNFAEYEGSELKKAKKLGQDKIWEAKRSRSAYTLSGKKASGGKERSERVMGYKLREEYLERVRKKVSPGGLKRVNNGERSEHWEGADVETISTEDAKCGEKNGWRDVPSSEEKSELHPLKAVQGGLDYEQNTLH